MWKEGEPEVRMEVERELSPNSLARMASHLARAGLGTRLMDLVMVGGDRRRGECLAEGA